MEHFFESLEGERALLFLFPLLKAISVRTSIEARVVAVSRTFVFVSVCLFAPRFFCCISEFPNFSHPLVPSIAHCCTEEAIDLPKITSSGPIDGTISPTLLDTVDVDEDRENIFDLAREQLALVVTEV